MVQVMMILLVVWQVGLIALVFGAGMAGLLRRL